MSLTNLESTGKKVWKYCLKVRDLTAGFGGKPAIEEVSFAVPPGEMVGVIGPNGAG